MKGQSRFHLKQPTGWFAAGREVACALELLSDATFKLFVWLCLHAERSRGVVSATPAGLARALGKDESAMRAALQELQRRGVCALQANGDIRISDRFWPYQRSCASSGSDESRRYVESVKRMFLERRCVQSNFTAADEKLAVSLYRRSVSLNHVEHAILLGAVRKYAFWLEHGQGTPISSLHYFADLFREVQQQISPQYWTYIAQKVKAFEKTWAGSASTEANNHVFEGQSEGCNGSAELAIDAPGPS